MVSLSHNFIISLGVTAITSTLIFFYFRQKMNQMEYKLNTLFQLIQDYTAESQSMQHRASANTLPVMNNSTNIDGDSTSQSAPVQEKDLINVSDNNDNDSDDDDDDDSDDDDYELSSSDDDDENNDNVSNNNETLNVPDLNTVSMDTKVINLVDNIQAMNGGIGIQGIIEINSFDVIKEPEETNNITIIEDDNGEVLKIQGEKTNVNTLDTLKPETIDIIGELIGAISTTTTEMDTLDTTIIELSATPASKEKSSLRLQLDAIDYKKFNVEKIRSLASEYNLVENVKNIKKKQLIEILDTVQ